MPSLNSVRPMKRTVPLFPLYKIESPTLSASETSGESGVNRGLNVGDGDAGGAVVGVPLLDLSISSFSGRMKTPRFSEVWKYRFPLTDPSFLPIQG
jgi:hypothetical protein